MGWINNKFETIKWKHWIIYCVLLFAVGVVINYVTEFSFPHFYTHQILLIFATTMLVYAMKSFFVEIKLMGLDPKTNLLAKEPEISGLFKKRFLPLQRSIWILVVSFCITTFFFSCIVLLEYIEIDAIGLYAIYIAGSSVMIGVYGYLQYLFFLWFIHQASKCKFNCYEYNFYVPAESDWISKMATISQQLRNFFLFIGLIYVIEYSILIPADKITFRDGTISLNTPNNVAFVVSWIALFILVILAFPILNHIQYNLVVTLVDKHKAHAIGELSEMMHEEQHNYRNKTYRFSTIVIYNILIENIRQSKSYPIKRQLSYETLMTIITFAVHIINLTSKVFTLTQA